MLLVEGRSNSVGRSSAGPTRNNKVNSNGIRILLYSTFDVEFEGLKEKILSCWLQLAS